MKKFSFTKARALFAGAVVVLIVAGLLSHAAPGTWSALGIESITAICPVGALEIMLGSRTFLLHPFILFLAVVLGVLLLGKAFCAWACPVPWLQKFFRPGKKHSAEKDSSPAKDATDGLGSALHSINEHNVVDGAVLAPVNECSIANSASPVPAVDAPPSSPSSEKPLSSPCLSCAAHCSDCTPLPPVGGKRDGLQLDTRHFTLIGALGSAAIFGFPVFCLICPIGLTAATFVGIFHLLQFNETSWGLVVFPVLLLLEVVFFRKWCSKICPISALLSLISTGNRTFRPRVNNSRCLRHKGIDCRACVTVCPQQLDPHSKRIPECVKCGACATACPEAAISFVGRKNAAPHCETATTIQ